MKSDTAAELVELQAPDYVSVKLALACSNEIRVKILDTLSKRVMSIAQFIQLFPKYTYSQARGQFRKLEEWGFLEVVETRTGGKRRSATERFYRANVRSLFDQARWAELPPILRGGVTTSAYSTLIDRIAEALKAGTIDVRPDRHFSWTDPEFDQQAWDETIEDLKRLFYLIPVRAEDAAQRLKKSGEQAIPVTVALACFESPPIKVTESPE